MHVFQTICTEQTMGMLFNGTLDLASTTDFIQACLCDSACHNSRQFLHFPSVAVFGSRCCLKWQPVEEFSLATNVPMFIIPCVNLCNESMLNCPYHALQCSEVTEQLCSKATTNWNKLSWVVKIPYIIIITAIIMKKYFNRPFLISLRPAKTNSCSNSAMLLILPTIPLLGEDSQNL